MASERINTNQPSLLARILNSSLDGIMLFSAIRDQANHIVDFQFDFVNRTSEKIVGRTKENLLGHTLLDVFPGTKADGLFDAYKRVVETGDPFCTKYHDTHDGLNHWFRIKAVKCGDGFTVTFADITAHQNNELIQTCGSVQDITEQVEQQHKLQTQQHRLEFALQASRSGLWDWQLESGQTYFSDTWYTMLGYDVGEMPMHVQSWINITEPADLKRATAALQDYFAGKTDRYTCELRVKNKAGDWQWILDVGEAVERDTNGKITRMVGLHVDIHDQKIAQQTIEQSRDLAEQANLSKSAFVANMSHEIRTPMGAILGYADLLLDGSQTEADKRNHAQTIRRNGKHLLSILNDILDFSKIEAGKLSIEQVRCAPNELFDGIISLMTPKADRKGIELSFNTDGQLPECFKSDPTRIRQVLINLVGNAIKFTKQGKVELAVRIDPIDESAANLTCEVRDTGIGISIEQMKHLFKPFSQADESTTRKFGGTGLGLSISSNLCDMLGGKLTCTSTLGQGSTFTATFRVQSMKACVVDPPTRQQSRHELTDESLTDKRILIVEDGPDNQRLLKHYFCKAGASVELVEDGAMGKDIALAMQKAGQSFDAILMDMQMPVLDGYNATRQLRMAGCNVPIIALTAHASSNDRDKCLDAGCTDYLSKPVERKRLLQIVADYANAGTLQSTRL